MHMDIEVNNIGDKGFNLDKLPNLSIVGYDRTQEYKKFFNMNAKPTEVIKKTYSKFAEMGGIVVSCDGQAIMDAAGEKHSLDDEYEQVNFHEVYSDILFNDTIPAPYLLMESDCGAGQVCLASRDYIISTFFEYMKILDEHPNVTNSAIDWYPKPIGCVKVTLTPEQIICAMICFGGRGSKLTLSTEVMLMGSYLTPMLKEMDDNDYKYNLTEESQYHIFVQITKAQTFLNAWYATQILLMNPILKEKVKRKTVPMPEGVLPKSRAKKAPKKYIKSIIIDDNDLEELQICCGKNKRKFKEPVWYVMGHWRHYKSGKRIFIHGYWKGPEKYRKTLEAPRERELQDVVFYPPIDK